jgi:general nucleoside transport system ATP-binding protein
LNFRKKSQDFSAVGQTRRDPSGVDRTKVELGSTIVEMKGITKRFPGVLADDQVDLEIRAGEVHALLGENGAGKTTLMNVLYGLLKPEEGEIFVRGKKVVIQSPADAIKLGIGMVHQHFMLIPVFSVKENIVLGMRSPKEPFLDLVQPKKKIDELSKKFNLKVDPDAKIWQLSMGEQQRVEILKALYRGIEILILDEPTSVLTPPEVDDLFNTLHKMAQLGLTVIFITHKLKEVMNVSQRVTVLKNGKFMRTLETDKTDEHELATLMVGRELVENFDKSGLGSGEVALEAQNLEALNDRGLPALKKASLQLHRGEILGIAGVAGNGQREFVEVITGMRKATGGKVLVDGKDLTNASPRESIDHGLAYVPEDRMGVGLVMSFPLTENIIMKNPSDFADSWVLKKIGLSSKRFNWFFNKGEIDKKTNVAIQDYDVKTPSNDVTTKTLSGGNLQKLILAREFSRNPKILIVDQPTRGLDVGATEYVHIRLAKSRNDGVAVMLISEDLDEIISLSDRIAVMYEGEIVGIVKPDVDIKDLGLMMAGASKLNQVA